MQDAAARKAQEAAFVPEEEEDAVQPMDTQPGPAPPDRTAVPTSSADGSSIQPVNGLSGSAPTEPAAAAMTSHPQPDDAQPAASDLRQPSTQPQTPPEPAVLKPGLNLQKRPQAKPDPAAAAKAGAAGAPATSSSRQSQLMADLARLQGLHEAGAPADDPSDPSLGAVHKNVPQEEVSDLEWRPPSGQTGDGRTSLNAKLGY